MRINGNILFFSLLRPEEESSSSSSDEDEDDRKQIDELLGKVVCVDYISLDKKKALWFPALVSSFTIKEFNFKLYKFMKKTIFLLMFFIGTKRGNVFQKRYFVHTKLTFNVVFEYKELLKSFRKGKILIILEV